MKQYQSKGGRTLYKPSLEEVQEMDDMGLGFCLACGSTQAAEPDARKYPCEECKEEMVYGAQELAIMGLVYLLGYLEK